jgi:uncharacterized protein YqgQ
MVSRKRYTGVYYMVRHVICHDSKLACKRIYSIPVSINRYPNYQRIIGDNMNKKDFVTFARMIRTMKHQAKLMTPEESKYEIVILGTRLNMIDSIVNELCEIFQNDNSQFNRAKFIQACEIDTESK